MGTLWHLGKGLQPLQQGGADFMFCPRAQNTQATPLDLISMLKERGEFSREEIISRSVYVWIKVQPNGIGI